MGKNHGTVRALPIAMMLSALAASLVLGQGGTGRENTNTAKPAPTPKKATTKKRTPAMTTSDSNTNRPAKSTTNDSTAAEMIFWNSIKDSKNPEDFRSYLKKYPKGEFTDLARNRLSRLEDAASWEKIKDSTNPEDFKEYLKKYPNGQFVGLARDNLTRLETAAKTPLKRDSAGRIILGSISGSNDGAAKPVAKPGSLVRNQMGMELVYVPPGSFMMGSTNGTRDERPVHQVAINYSFYMGKYEVTQGQWQTVMGSNPSSFKDCGGNCPVEQVSWDDVQNFINKLNESSDGFRYRLPTEAEWEYACRAGTTGDYAGNLSEMAWYSENAGSETHAVGGKQPNAWGLADMHGNVWEWCQDWYHETYYGAPTDGSAWLSGGEKKYRVLRGGSWLFNASDLRSANRLVGYPPGTRYDGSGFRVVAVARTQ